LKKGSQSIMAWWITVAKKNNNRIKTNAFPAKKQRERHPQYAFIT